MACPLAGWAKVPRTSKAVEKHGAQEARGSLGTSLRMGALRRAAAACESTTGSGSGRLPPEEANGCV